MHQCDTSGRLLVSYLTALYTVRYGTSALVVIYDTMVFIFSYVIYHSSRRAFSNTKDSLSKEWSPTPCNATWPCLDPYKVC